MKNQVTNNAYSFFKSFFTPAALALVLIGISIPFTGSATEKKETSETPVQITYLGKVELQLVFQIEVDNAKEEDLYAVVKDEDGNTIYSEKFREKKFSKKFRFNLPDTNNMNLTFTLSSRNGKSQSLRMKSVITSVEDVVVTRVQ